MVYDNDKKNLNVFWEGGVKEKKCSSYKSLHITPIIQFCCTL